MLAAMFLVHDDGAGLSLEAQFLFQDLDAVVPLLKRHDVIFGRVDVDVIKALRAARTLGQGLPVPEGLVEIGRQGLEFENIDHLVGVAPLKVLGELFRSGAAAALDNHGPGPSFLPSA